MINAKHAPIGIPRVTIDPAHKQRNLIAANAALNWATLSWQKEFSTTSASLVTALSYTGRGVLTRLVVGEITSAATTVRAGFTLKVTIDGVVVFNNSAVITRESSWRVVVGRFSETGGTNHSVLDSPIGLPFSDSCRLEIASDGTRTLSVGWHLNKKL